MKTASKIFIILTIITFIGVIVPSNISNAGLSDLADRMDAETEEASKEVGSLTTLAGRVLGVLQLVSGLGTLLIIAFTGFEYIIAETPDIRQELKKRMFPIIIGLLFVFSAVSIATLIIGAFE